MAKLDDDKYLKSGSKFYCFAGYPSIKIYKKSTGNAWYEHLLFGDYILVRDLEIKNKRIKVRCRNSNGWANVSQIFNERVLEVNFIDIGQGDGCHIVTPDDQHILIDAGEYDNMNRYLYWRFYLYNKTKPLPFDFKVVISHSDKDHYKGFEHVFANNKIRVSEIYHNGIVERPGEKHAFGKVENGLITSMVVNTPQMLEIITDPDKRKGKNSMYPKVIYKALKYNPDVQFKMVSIEDNYLANFDESNKVNNKDFKIKTLGPIIETKNGKTGLRTIKDQGKDKNGHSVLLKLVYDKARILLGGDINEEFGELITDHFKKSNSLGELQVDAAKSCHHGSNHFHYGFLEAINAPATVISSGDDESYCHPRPDTLGALGKCGYGQKPLIFSTELARSNKEITRKNIVKISDLFGEIESLKKQISELKKGGSKKDDPALKDCESKVSNCNKEINSFLTKYGMINLRTDGRKMIIAQKLERPAGHGKWDIHQLEYNIASNRFELVE
jgi:beta-lactamase superfamily II metal-dependent hydrolase